MRIQAWHIIVLIVVIIVVFGSARLPQVAESVGKSLKIFKREVKELREDDAEETVVGELEGGETPDRGLPRETPTSGGTPLPANGGQERPSNTGTDPDAPSSAGREN